MNQHVTNAAELLKLTPAAEYLTSNGLPATRQKLRAACLRGDIEFTRPFGEYLIRKEVLDKFLTANGFTVVTQQKVASKAKANETLSRHNITPSGQRVSPTSTSSNCASGRPSSGGSSPSTAAPTATAKRNK